MLPLKEGSLVILLTAIMISGTLIPDATIFKNGDYNQTTIINRLFGIDAIQLPLITEPIIISGEVELKGTILKPVSWQYLENKPEGLQTQTLEIKPEGLVTQTLEIRPEVLQTQTSKITAEEPTTQTLEVTK